MASRSAGAMAWVGEITFILVVVLLLKEWVFPWLIWLWFPTGDDAARMLEWMVIMVGVITLFAYAGFGSVSAHGYQLSGIEATVTWFLIHLPLAVIFFSPLRTIPWLNDIFHAWNGLIGDGLRLFIPELPLETGLIPLICLLFFWMGRSIRVLEKPEQSQEKQPGEHRI